MIKALFYEWQQFMECLWLLKSAATHYFQHLVQGDKEENIRALHDLFWLGNGFPSQRANNVEIIFMSWGHHLMLMNALQGHWLAIIIDLGSQIYKCPMTV